MTVQINQQKMVDYLYEAERDVKEVIKLTDDYPQLTIQEAYRIQDALLARKLEENGTKQVGVKLGLTSKAKQQMICSH